MPNAAAIIIPPDVLLDSSYARSCRAYANRRGYPEPTVTRSWNKAHELLLAGGVQVVIVAQCEQAAVATGAEADADEGAGMTTVTILANWRGRRFGPGRHRASRSNRRRIASKTADQLIDDAVRRWRFGLPRRARTEVNKVPRSGYP